MNLDEFLDLSCQEITELMRAGGPKVCVFPINGTRRWFLLEHPPSRESDFASDYLDVSARRHIELYRLLFDHGIGTVLSPLFGPDLFERGDDYLRMVAVGLARVVEDPQFTEFYEEYGIRARFYGDFRKYFDNTPFAYLLDLFEQLADKTARHEGPRLFFGVCANDPAETIAELAVRYYARQGVIPDKMRLIELYYGERVPPADFFIGFGRFTAFDMPLIATGDEDLYFTINPSPYLTESQLRGILHDHLFARREEETDYSTLNGEGWAAMREFYRQNQGRTLGVGARNAQGGYWYPLPQVRLPDGFHDSQT